MLSRPVFCGPGGAPANGEFATVLLERRDPRIDQLYKTQPSPVALQQDARELGQVVSSVGTTRLQGAEQLQEAFDATGVQSQLPPTFYSVLICCVSPLRTYLSVKKAQDR